MECAFDVEYISRAWAGRPGVPDLTHRGTLFMPNGDVFNYDLSRLKGGDNSIYTKIKNSTKVGRIKSSIMNDLCYLFTKIDEKPIVSLHPTAFDLGSFNFTGYKLMLNGIWKPIRLGCWGDPAGLHPNPISKLLINKLSCLTGKDPLWKN